MRKLRGFLAEKFNGFVVGGKVRQFTGLDYRADGGAQCVAPLVDNLAHKQQVLQARMQDAGELEEPVVAAMEKDGEHRRFRPSGDRRDVRTPGLFRGPHVTPLEGRHATGGKNRQRSATREPLERLAPALRVEIPPPESSLRINKDITFLKL